MSLTIAAALLLPQTVPAPAPTDQPAIRPADPTTPPDAATANTPNDMAPAGTSPVRPSSDNESDEVDTDRGAADATRPEAEAKRPR